jgi:hypothetical protein
VLTGNDVPVGGRVLVEGSEVEPVDVRLAVAGAEDDEVVGAAVDESRAGQRDGPCLARQHVESLDAEPVWPQVAADGLVAAADVLLPPSHVVGSVSEYQSILLSRGSCCWWSRLWVVGVQVPVQSQVRADVPQVAGPKGSPVPGPTATTGSVASVPLLTPGCRQGRSERGSRLDPCAGCRSCVRVPVGGCAGLARADGEVTVLDRATVLAAPWSAGLTVAAVPRYRCNASRIASRSWMRAGDWPAGAVPQPGRRSGGARRVGRGAARRSRLPSPP